MRVPLEWLHEYCAPAVSTPDLAERLAMTGTEVERVEHHGVRAVEHFVVGLVVEAEPHPNADRLKACLVDIGEQSPVQIVCGAPNVAAGQTVAVARPGAVMPDGTTLRAAKLRGLESNGMILAEDELALGLDHAGIMVLDPHGNSGLRPGSPLSAVLPLATDVLELEITPNRPDCLSIYGVARETHAATGAPLAPPPWSEDPGSAGEIGSAISISVQTPPELCRRFTARVFEDVTIGPSPSWLKGRLMAAGQRPISNVVDITNYVMLLTGQPLHAFDLDRVAGARLVVRTAGPEEQVVTLDGQTRTLDEQMVVIDDADGPTSIAGVMGGERSEVHEGTTRVLMEAATWDGPNIHRTSKGLGLRSEASTRFEKQTQPEQAIEAQAVAARLMVELCGARLLPGTVDIGGDGPPPRHIELRDERVRGLLGAPVERDDSRRILAALGFAVRDADGGLDVAVPAHRRADITREADVIEEVARLGALDTLPATLPSRHGASGRLTARQLLRRRAADALAAQGLHEIVGWSFVAPDLPRRLRQGDDDGARPPVVLTNPMSSEQSRLRTTLLGSLLDAARHNRAHGAAAIRLFESGAVYVAAEEPGALPREPHHLGALLSGPVKPPTWRAPDPPAADFFAVKGVLSGLLTTLRVTFELEPAAEPFLHPGRAAVIAAAGEPIGWVGELHPLVAAEWDLGEDPVGAFELDLDALAGLAPQTALYSERTAFPAVREDLAVVVPDDVSAAQVTGVVLRAGAPLLQSAEVFDVYRDPDRIGAGNVSLALRLQFAAADRTLTDEEVAAHRLAITEALASDLGGRVRAG